MYRGYCDRAGSNWPVGADLFVLSEEEETFARVHPPRLVAALWSAYEALFRLSSTANFNAKIQEGHGAGCHCAYHEARAALAEVERCARE